LELSLWKAPFFCGVGQERLTTYQQKVMKKSLSMQMEDLVSLCKNKIPMDAFTLMVNEPYG
jgi:hypothetical protein